MFPGLRNIADIVNCRVGSLEKEDHAYDELRYVNCRVGSLEMYTLNSSTLTSVNCRVGSLEYIDIVQNKCWIFLP